MDERIGFEIYQSCGSVGRVSVFWLRWCEWVGGLEQCLEG